MRATEYQYRIYAVNVAGEGSAASTSIYHSGQRARRCREPDWHCYGYGIVAV